MTYSLPLASAAGDHFFEHPQAPWLVLAHLPGLALVALWSEDEDVAQARQALAARQGALVGLSTGQDLAARCRLERHICIDTTAAGGNAQLLAASG